MNQRQIEGIVNEFIMWAGLEIIEKGKSGFGQVSVEEIKEFVRRQMQDKNMED
jgi:sulfite exporter TauE/SafE